MVQPTPSRDVRGPSLGFRHSQILKGAGVEPNRFLYHYTTREAAFEHILPERRLRLSPYSLMRDPSDAKDWSFGFTFRGDATGATPSELQGQYATDFAKAIKRRSKLLSLSRDETSGIDLPFGMGWARTSMWERYAEGHRGVCLAFDRERLEKRANEELQNLGADQVASRNVVYSRLGLYGKGATTLEVDLSVDAEELAARHVEQHAEALFFSKTSEWEPEHEFRIVATVDTDDYIYFDYGDCLEMIVVGDRFPAIEAPGVLQVCSALRAEPRRFVWSANRPYLFGMGGLGSEEELEGALAQYREWASDRSVRLPKFAVPLPEMEQSLQASKARRGFLGLRGCGVLARLYQRGDGRRKS